MIRGSIWTLPFGKIRFSQLNTASAGIVPHCRFFSARTEEMPEVIALDHVLIGLSIMASMNFRYSSFVQNSISFGCSLPIFPAFAAGLICKP